VVGDPVPPELLKTLFPNAKVGQNNACALHSLFFVCHCVRDCARLFALRSLLSSACPVLFRLFTFRTLTHLLSTIELNLSVSVFSGTEQRRRVGDRHSRAGIRRQARGETESALC
jgi:hypothetical protein